MSTEVVRFENKKEGRSVFLRYCGTPEQQTESGSVSRARLQVSLPRNTISFSFEEAQLLAQELTALFPPQQGREGATSPDPTTLLETTHGQDRPPG